MKTSDMKHLALLVAVVVALSGCSSTKVAKDFNGLSTPDGQAMHLNTSNMAIHLMLGKNPVWGDATLEKTVSDFTAAAKANGATKVDIVQSSARSWWFIFFPFTLLVTPVTSNVAGNAIS